MLPSNIDLTEHRDFGGGSGMFFDTPIEIPMDEYNLMTCDEYEHLMWWEGIFGRKGHHSQKLEIFDKDSNFLNKSRDHCWRCGKLIRIPWNNMGGICKDCNDIVGGNDSGTDERIPWKSHYGERPIDVAYNLFNRR